MPLLEQSLVDSVIKRALRSGADFVELFVERKRNQSISVEESKVQRVNSGNDLGAGLRIIHQGTVSYVYTEDLSEDGLLKTADLAAQIGRRGGGRFAFAELSGAPRPPQRIEVPPDTVGSSSATAVVPSVSAVEPPTYSAPAGSAALTVATPRPPLPWMLNAAS